MKRTLLLLLLLTAAPLSAQSNTVTLFVTSQHNDGGSRFPSASRDLTTDFETGSGYGASYARAIGRWSGELAIFRLSSEALIREGSASMDLGDVELTPITGMARFHLRPQSAFGVYAGAGVAYVMTDDLDNVDAGTVPIDNELTLAVGAGISYDFTPRIGAALDARYLPLTLRGEVDGESVDADMNPLLLSAGLRIRF